MPPRNNSVGATIMNRNASRVTTLMPNGTDVGNIRCRSGSSVSASQTAMHMWPQALFSAFRITEAEDASGIRERPVIRLTLPVFTVASTGSWPSNERPCRRCWTNCMVNILRRTTGRLELVDRGGHQSYGYTVAAVKSCSSNVFVNGRCRVHKHYFLTGILTTKCYS